MKITAEKLFEPVREALGKPMRIISFYRSPAVNKAVGGSKSSQHMTGEAIDVQGMNGLTNAEIYYHIKNGCVDFDQIIWEFGDDREPSWVHISYTEKRANRRQSLRAKKDKRGKTVYVPGP